MQLDRLAIVLRPRRANEAIDLGVRMAMHWFKPLYCAWLCFAAPLLALLLACAFWLEFSYFATYLLIWWFKPLLDRMALLVISRAVFGDPPTLRQSLRAIPSLLRKTRLFRALTWARFSPCRSLTLPIDMLEGVPSHTAKLRRKAIANDVGINAAMLTWSGFVLEQIFPLCAMAFLAMLSMDNDSDAMIDLILLSDFSYLSIVSLGLFMLGGLLWEPIYVAAGFALYLKRRSDIEAWDIELQFRQIEAKHTKNPATLFSALFAALTLWLSAYSLPVEASDSLRQQAIAQAPQTLSDILTQPEYGGTINQKEWQWRKKRNDAKPKHTVNPAPNDTARSTRIDGFASVSQGVLWLILALILALLVYFILVRLPIIRDPKTNRDRPPTQIAGLDIQPQSLPDNIADVALTLIHQGDLRAALSLLFRASLSVLAHRDRVPFQPSDTEQDCLRKVKLAALNRSDFFLRVTQLWLAQAYAHRSPDLAQLEQLCREWPTHFDHQSQWEAN